MRVIETRRDDIRSLKGVHLFHFATSNCSQRVRFVLEEKGVGWVSHHVDLIKSENATPDFIAINPRGVVPVLIDDGQTIIESNDIIRYVDQKFDGPVLCPGTDADGEYLEESLKRSSAFQGALKLLTYEFLFKPFRRMNERQLDDYSKGTQNPELVSFMREFSSEEGFKRERIIVAVKEAGDVLNFLQARLKARPWLTGNDFGLVDISWVVNIHRFSHMHYPVSSFPLVTDWLERVRARPAFRRAIGRFESKKAIIAFNVYSILRRIQHSSVRYFATDNDT